MSSGETIIVNRRRARLVNQPILELVNEVLEEGDLEATTGFEPMYTDLQSAA